ncbi:MAG: tyrosine-type recombinase/integrase [Planctomycetaceae bacterium]|nr:tyrosine-type recombinase/integrase [Planctomycetaceae bacterium]
MPVAKITKKLVDSLKSAEKQYLVHDQLLKGFGVRVTPNGHKAFFIDYRPGEGGRKVLKKRMVIGVVGKLTCDQARNLAREKLAAVQLGEDPAADREKKRQTLNLREFGKRYLDEEAVRRLKSSTICNYEINLRRHANPHIGHLKITEIARTDIIQMHNAIGEKSPITANRTVETISAVFRYAQDKGLVEEGHNPTKGVRSFKESRRERFLSEEEFVRLGASLRLAETEGIPWANLARDDQSKHAVKVGNQRTVFSSVAINTIRLLIFTGCRLREILNLTWEEVDLERGLLFLADSKTGARAVVLNQLAHNILERQLLKGVYVFATEFEDKPRADLNKPWRAVRRHAGLEDVRLHDLRHSFASVGASAGMGLPIVGALLGHKQAATTERYAHLDASPLRQASDEISLRIEAAMNGTRG